MWTLHNVASAYGCRPSAVLEVPGSWAAYQLDVAVLTFGRWVENKLAERDTDGNPRHSVGKLLGTRRMGGQDEDRAWADPRSLMHAIG